MPRPEVGQDPETVVNRFGNFVPSPVLKQVAEAKSIRTIGPAYYYQPSVPVQGLYRKLPSQQFTLSLVGLARADLTD